jgi:hypothetical protein
MKPSKVILNSTLLGLVLFWRQFCLASPDFELWNATHLIEIKQGSELSNKMGAWKMGGYELSNGTPVSFRSWYTPTFTDTRVTYMTQVHPKVGLIWGFSTGESAQKYTVDPSIKLGLVFRHELDKTSFFSLRGTTILAGRLRESACTANYGDIGGVQQVNCRLAASPMQPSQTLQYLYNEKPYNYNTLWLQYTKNFD